MEHRECTMEGATSPRGMARSGVSFSHSQPAALVTRPERGHVGTTLAAALGIAGAACAAIGIHGGSETTEIVGVALFGAAIVLGTAVPHLWLRKIYRRIDRITDESDPDKHVGRSRIEL